MGLAFLRSIIVARGLGIQFYGIYVLISSFVTALQDFFNLNIGAAFIKFGGEFKAENRTDKIVALAKYCLFATTISALLSVLLIVTLVIFTYSTFVTTPGLEVYVVLYSIADIVTFFDPLGKSMLRLYYKFKVNSIVQTITSALEVIVIAIVIFVFPKDLKSFFIAVVSIKITNMFINNGLMFYELRHEFLPHLKCKMNLVKGRMKEILGFVFANSLTKTLQTVIWQGDVLLLGAMAGPAPVAFYNIGKRLSLVAMVIIDPFTFGIYPQLSRLLAEKRFAETKTMLINLTKAVLYPSLVLIPLLFFFRFSIIELFYGSEYIPGGNPFIISVVGTFVVTLCFWNQPFLQSIGMVRFRLLVHAFGIVAGGMTAFMLIPSMSASGLAIGVVVAKSIINLLLTKATYSHLKKNIQN